MSDGPAGHRFERVDLRTAPDAVLHDIVSVAGVIEREDLPQPPWTPASEWVAELRGDAGIQDRADWLVRAPDGSPSARAAFFANRTGENRHRAKLVVEVVPAHRRQGLGTALLRLVAGAAVDAGRTVVQAWTTTGGAGASFADAHGIEAEDELELNRLRLADVDRQLLQRWITRARERAGDYELVWWQDRCPPELREPYARLREAMNSAPQTRDHVAETFTVERLDALEASWEEGGLPWWTLCARHTGTGQLAGYTELAFSEEEPALAYQGDTAVDPAHRERGLGRWLKAAMVLRALEERPATSVIDTYNAGSNDAMIAINRQLGFRVVLHTERRRADLPELAGRLGIGGGAGGA